jgi:ankyrin repeat protein
MGLSALVTCCLAGSSAVAPSRLALCLALHGRGHGGEGTTVLDDADPQTLVALHWGGNTVLHLAARSNAVEALGTAVRLLRAPGAAEYLEDVASAGDDGGAGQVIPVRPRSSPAERDVDQAAFHSFLNRANSAGMTAMMVAAKKGHVGIVQALLDAVSAHALVQAALPTDTRACAAACGLQDCCLRATRRKPRPCTAACLSGLGLAWPVGGRERPRPHAWQTRLRECIARACMQPDGCALSACGEQGVHTARRPRSPMYPDLASQSVRSLAQLPAST